MRSAIRTILLSGIDPDALAWRNAVVAAGSSVSGPQLNNVSRLIRGLKSSGVWSSLDRLWLFASENSTQARRDLVALAVATPQNSPTFTANRGYTGDGLSAYIDLNFNASTAGGKYARDAALYGPWIRTLGSVSNQSPMGNDDVNWGEMQTTTLPAYLTGINQSVAPTTVGGSPLGLLVVERSDASTVTPYLNGATGSAQSKASIAVSNTNFFALAGNQGGSAVRFYDAGISAAAIGGLLGATRQAALYNRLRTYMTAVGVP